jgi:hypothetical protein
MQKEYLLLEQAVKTPSDKLKANPDTEIDQKFRVLLGAK